MCEAKLIDSDVERCNMWSITVPFKEVSDFVATANALIDLFDQHVSNKVRIMSIIALKKYSPRLALGGEAHMDRNRKLFFKALVNSFYNNKQHSTEQQTV